MTNIIYVVTDGEYSDYHIVGVFTSKEKAEIVHKLYPDSYIEEYDLDVVPEHPPGMVAWSVRIMVNDTSDITVRQNPPMEAYAHMWEGNQHFPASYNVGCWARNEEHAKKIALDKFYQHQAIEQGMAL